MPCTDARCKRVSPLWRLTMLLRGSASECYILPGTLHSCSIRFSPVFVLFVQQEAGIDILDAHQVVVHTCFYIQLRPCQSHSSESRLLAVNTSTAAAVEMGLQV